MLQFTVSIAMIIGTIIVFRQVEYARSRPVGYDQGGLIMMHQHTRDIDAHFEAFRNTLKGTGVVSEVAESVAPVTESWPFNGGLKWTGHTQWNGEEDFSMKGVTSGYAKTVGLQFVEGRDFRETDTFNMILNEAAVRNMKIKDPIAKTVTWQKTNFTVIGVVKDVVMESPYETPFPARSRSHGWYCGAGCNNCLPRGDLLVDLRRCGGRCAGDYGGDGELAGGTGGADESGKIFTKRIIKLCFQ